MRSAMSACLTGAPPHRRIIRSPCDNSLAFSLNSSSLSTGRTANGTYTGARCSPAANEMYHDVWTFHVLLSDCSRGLRVETALTLCGFYIGESDLVFGDERRRVFLR